MTAEDYFKENDVVIYMMNYSKDQLGMFTYEMDYDLDVTYIHLLTHDGDSVNINALRSALWRVSNVWKTGYYKDGRYMCNVQRRTKFLIPLLSEDIDKDVAKKLAIEELEGRITFI